MFCCCILLSLSLEVENGSANPERELLVEHRASSGDRSAAMGLYQIMEAFLLMANAIAILNEDRFLAPYGLGMADIGRANRSPFKVQMIGFIHAVQYLRVPLIVANGIVIVSKLLFG